MIKTLALTALAATVTPFMRTSPLAPPAQTAVPEPKGTAIPAPPKPTSLEARLGQERAQLEAFDERARDRQRARDHQLELTQHLRVLQRAAKTLENQQDSALQLLVGELSALQIRLARLPKLGPDVTPNHSGYRAAQTFRDQIAIIEGKIAARQTAREKSKGQVDADIVETEFAIRGIDESLEMSMRRAVIMDELEQAALAIETARPSIFEQLASPSPESQPTPRKAPSPIVIVDDFQAARAQAAALGRPLLVNFTAHSSQGARLMEVSVLSAAGPAQLLAGVVEARLHTDTNDSTLAPDVAYRQSTLARSIAVPSYVLLDPRTGAELAHAEGLEPNALAFTDFLEAGLSSFGGPPPPANDQQLWRRIFDLQDQVAALQAAADPSDR